MSTLTEIDVLLPILIPPPPPAPPTPPIVPPPPPPHVVLLVVPVFPAIEEVDEVGSRPEVLFERLKPVINCASRASIFSPPPPPRVILVMLLYDDPDGRLCCSDLGDEGAEEPEGSKKEARFSIPSTRLRLLASFAKLRL